MLNMVLVVIVAVRIEADALNKQIDQRAETLANALVIFSDRLHGIHELQRTLAALAAERDIKRLVISDTATQRVIASNHLAADMASHYPQRI